MPSDTKRKPAAKKPAPKAKNPAPRANKPVAKVTWDATGDKAHVVALVVAKPAYD